MASSVRRAKRPAYLKDLDGATRSIRAHAGKGAIGVKYFFGTEKAASPAIIMMYILPPGTSEGMHTHALGDKRKGSYDEYYYIVAGRGQMDIAGERVRVKKGDHIFTPNGVPHAIENTAKKGELKVHLVALRR